MTTEAPVSVENAGQKTLINVEAENVDFRNAESLKTALSDLVRDGKSNLVFNLTNVNFMDSSGLSVLLTGKRAAEEAGGSFSICGLQGYVNNLITLTNLNKTIAVYATPTDATSAN